MQQNRNSRRLKLLSFLPIFIFSSYTVFAGPFDALWNIVRDFSTGFITTLGDNQYVFPVIMYFFLVIIFRYLLQLAFSFLPVFGGAVGAPKFGIDSGHANDKVKSGLSTWLAILLATGLLGFMGNGFSQSGYNFSVQNIRDNSVRVATLFGVIGSWMIGSVFGLMMYFVFKSNKDKMSAGEIKANRKYTWMSVLLSVAVALYIQGAISGTNGSVGFATIFAIIGGLMMISVMTKSKENMPGGFADKNFFQKQQITDIVNTNVPTPNFTALDSVPDVQPEEEGKRTEIKEANELFRNKVEDFAKATESLRKGSNTLNERMLQAMNNLDDQDLINQVNSYYDTSFKTALNKARTTFREAANSVPQVSVDLRFKNVSYNIRQELISHFQEVYQTYIRVVGGFYLGKYRKAKALWPSMYKRRMARFANARGDANVYDMTGGNSGIPKAGDADVE